MSAFLIRTKSHQQARELRDLLRPFGTVACGAGVLQADGEWSDIESSSGSVYGNLDERVLALVLWFKVADRDAYRLAKAFP